MGFLSFLFGGKPDPTREWPPALGPAPEFDVERMTLGSLAFGGSLDEAKFLGRPEESRWISGRVLQLLWARRGLLLEFEDGRLSFLAWIIGPDLVAPTHRDLRFARPHPVGGPVLDGRTSEQDLTAWLGPPGGRDKDEDETILEWEKDGLILEFELTPAGCLKRWNVYEE